MAYQGKYWYISTSKKISKLIHHHLLVYRSIFTAYPYYINTWWRAVQCNSEKVVAHGKIFGNKLKALANIIVHFNATGKIGLGHEIYGQLLVACNGVGENIQFTHIAYFIDPGISAISSKVGKLAVRRAGVTGVESTHPPAIIFVRKGYHQARATHYSIYIQYSQVAGMVDLHAVCCRIWYRVPA